MSNWELIVVNDGSKDNSEAVIRQYQDKFSHFTL
ncbi:glycosyltransferase [Providencia thailandensis]|nr:glycosyltransferase [Providencia thailandensis]MDF4176317.1 glycosyltransferase [Providencia thailandensis]